jgi:NAD(P)-dependent dehydrogenase (short-subunit alcohol dehydrogenase family)
MASGPAQLFCVAGKNVLVTGGSRGIGYMIALVFVERGANVLITSRDPRGCKEAASSLLSLRRPLSSSSSTSSSSQVHHVASNVSTREGCRALAMRAWDIFDGRLDVFVNNAGTSWGEDPGYNGGRNSRESSRMNWGWDMVLDLNIKGLFYLTRECVPMLQRRAIGDAAARGGGGHDNDASSSYSYSSYSSSSSSLPSYLSDPGRIINIGSVTGLMPQDAPTHAYDVSKAAVHHLTRKLASDLAPRGIIVNAIAPGYVLTRMSRGLLSTWTAARTKDGGGGGDPGDDDGGGGLTAGDGAMPILLGRMGNGDDMGGACIYLSSRAGSWITGVILPVDGGLVGAACIPLSNL